MASQQKTFSLEEVYQKRLRETALNLERILAEQKRKNDLSANDMVRRLRYVDHCSDNSDY